MLPSVVFCIISLFTQFIVVDGGLLTNGIQLKADQPHILLSSQSNVGISQKSFLGSKGNLPFVGDHSQLSSSRLEATHQKRAEPLVMNNPHKQPFKTKKELVKIDEKKVDEKIAQFMEGMEAKSFKIPNSNNLQIHYVTGGVPASKNVLLFVHGFPETSYAWGYQLEEFRKDSIVYAIDLVGYGESSQPDGALECTVDKHVEYIEKFVQKLKADHEGKQLTLVTHDIGAVIGCAFNYEHAELVDRFVMMNAPNPKSLHHMVETGALDIKQFLLHTPYLHKLFGFLLSPFPWHHIEHNNFEFLDQLFITDESTKVINEHNFDAADLGVYKRAYGKKGAAKSALQFFYAPGAKIIHGIPETVVEKFRNFVDSIGSRLRGEKREKPAVKLAEKIKTKSLLIGSDRDPVFPVKFAYGAKEEFERAKVIELKDASHFGQEDKAAEVNGHIRKFINKEYDGELD